MNYDSESNIASLELMSKSTISHAVKFGNFVIHLSKANTPVLIEILDASKITKRFDKIKGLPALDRVLRREGAMASQVQQ